MNLKIQSNYYYSVAYRIRKLYVLQVVVFFSYIVVVVRYGEFIFGNNKLELFYNI